MRLSGCSFTQYMAGATPNCCRLGARSVYTIQPQANSSGVTSFLIATNVGMIPVIYIRCDSSSSTKLWIRIHIMRFHLCRFIDETNILFLYMTPLYVSVCLCVCVCVPVCVHAHDCLRTCRLAYVCMWLCMCERLYE